MPEFYGSDLQVEIQKRMIVRHDWIMDTPSVANGGRVMNVLEPKKFGWSRVKEIVEEDGAVALTAMERASATTQLQMHFGNDYDFPQWDVHRSHADGVLKNCHKIMASFASPEGWRLECLTCPDNTELAAIQSLNLSTGVAPLPGPYLRSEIVPSYTTCLWTADGVLAATSNASFRYHANSRFGGHVFNGSTSVSLDHRGLGLGKVATAHILLESHRAINWTHAIAQVAPDNTPSKKMVEACGLTGDPAVGTYGVTQRGVTFTR